MRLLEHESKGIFKRYGIPVPEGKIIRRKEELKGLELPGVLKAQLPIGGRGKAGLIAICDSEEELERRWDELYGKNVDGYKADEILFEQRIEVERELYLSITVDRSDRKVILLASGEGGVEIEEIPRERIIKVEMERELQDFSARDIARMMGSKGEELQRLSSIVTALHSIFYDLDCALAEINPLALTKKGFVALDAKVELDDNALFRHRDLKVEKKFISALEEEASRYGLSYVQLDGDIGVIGNGAGLVMATLDMIKLSGGRPANFCDIGGGASPERVAKAIEMVLRDEKVRTIFLNIFAGITRCDDVARGLVDTMERLEKDGKKTGLVVRMIGTNEEEGRAILRERSIETMEEMEEGAKKVVELTRSREMGQNEGGERRKDEV
jgi:succinyl-CoA synthetase beta subunit